MTFILARITLKLKLLIKEIRNNKGAKCYVLCQNKKSEHAFFRLLFPEIQYIRGSLNTGKIQEQLCTGLFLIIQKPPKTLRRKTHKVQHKKL